MKFYNGKAVLLPAFQFLRPPLLDIKKNSSLPDLLLSGKTTPILPAIARMKAADGTVFCCRVWQGRKELPTVVYLHGIEGHSQWFENTASVLNSKGITVYAPDRRGAGLNSAGDAKNIKILLDDLKSLFSQIKSESIVLIANCWSARIAVIISASNYKDAKELLGDRIKALVLTCPAIYTKVDFPLPVKISIFLDWILGNHYSLRAIPLEPSMFTNNPPYLSFVENDPFRLKLASTGFYVATFFLRLKAQMVAKNIYKPLLLLQAGADKIVDVKRIKKWYQQVGSPTKRLHIFPEAQHSLDFDQTAFAEYSNLLVNWILNLPL